jgi:hypothetical protein
MRKYIAITLLWVFSCYVGVSLGRPEPAPGCCPGANCPCPYGCYTVFGEDGNPKYIYFVDNLNLYACCQADTNTCTSVANAYQCVYYTGYQDSACSTGTDGTGPHNMPEYGCVFRSECKGS